MSTALPFPSDFRPCRAEDFIGDAAPAARAMQNLVDRTKDSGRSSAHLFIGQPGRGKSSLCEFTIHRLLRIEIGKIRSHYALRFFNGKNVAIETVRELQMELHSRPMFGEWRVIWIDEVDKMTPDAQVLMLSLLDDLPKNCLVLCTSNEDFSGPSKEKRFQSRFTVWTIGGPKPEDLSAWLQNRFQVPSASANAIAALAEGDVRAALKDADAIGLVAA